MIFRPCQDSIIPSRPDQLQKQDQLSDILKLIKKFPASSYDELTILFIDLLKSFADCESFSSLISELQDCELKRILLDESIES